MLGVLWKDKLRGLRCEGPSRNRIELKAQSEGKRAVWPSMKPRVRQSYSRVRAWRGFVASWSL